MVHILLEGAIAYKKEHEISIPENFAFDNQRGAWFDAESGCYLVDRPDRPGGGTKKNDIETGEDQKGQ